MLRPAQLLALLDWFDLELSSGRRGRLFPSLPGASHLDPESGITTQPSWGKTVTGLPPAGVLPLQAARPIAQHFRPRRHRCSALAYRQELRTRCQIWQEITTSALAA